MPQMCSERERFRRLVSMGAGDGGNGEEGIKTGPFKIAEIDG
jgi:hypothetical protein